MVVSCFKRKSALVTIDTFPFEYFSYSQGVFFYKKHNTRMKTPHSDIFISLLRDILYTGNNRVLLTCMQVFEIHYLLHVQVCVEI